MFVKFWTLLYISLICRWMEVSGLCRSVWGVMLPFCRCCWGGKRSWGCCWRWGALPGGVKGDDPTADIDLWHVVCSCGRCELTQVWKYVTKILLSPHWVSIVSMLYLCWTSCRTTAAFSRDVFRALSLPSCRSAPSRRSKRILFLWQHNSKASWESLLPANRLLKVLPIPSVTCEKVFSLKSDLYDLFLWVPETIQVLLYFFFSGL